VGAASRRSSAAPGRDGVPRRAGTVLPEERLTLEESIRAFTLGSPVNHSTATQARSRSASSPTRRDRSRPFAQDAEPIADRVLLTLVGGADVFEDPALG
jgi:hypothetical protein